MLPSERTNKQRKIRSNFWRCKTGSTILLFGLSLFFVAGAAGSGVDLARVYQERSKLQAAGDAAAIAAAKRRFYSLSTSEMQQTAQKAVDANYNGMLTNPVPVMVSNDGLVTVTLTGAVPMTLLNAVGMQSMTISTVSTARVPTAVDAEIVFVLDYSSSMDLPGKYDTMRDASIQLIEDLTNNKKSIDQNLKFGLVPFANYVHTKLPKMYVVGEDPTDTGDLDTCFFSRQHPHNTNDSTPVPTDDATRWVEGMPGSDPDPCKSMKDRKLQVVPLTSDKNKVIGRLQDMVPYQMTNISLGFQMGWHVISPNAPFEEGVAYSDNITRKYIILLSDGRQTVSDYGSGGSNSIADAESNLETMCTDAKAKGVNVVTVAFDLQDTATETRLRNCATSLEYYFDADTSSDLTQTFRKITDLLADNLRLTK